ncbi:MAG TPA: gliding motility-associated C-terminal domain-containing protein, partial [Saprospiraceae bacterium]
CEGDSITLSITPPTPGEYTWSGPGGFTSLEPTPTTLAQDGNYIVFLSSKTGCDAGDTTEVQVDVLPQILSLETDADSCVQGINTVTIWATTTPGFSTDYQYIWTGPAGFTVQDSSIIMDSATAAINGLYTLSIVNGSCTTESVSIEIDVDDSPAAPLIIGEDVYCYYDSIFLFIDSPIDGAMYSWTSSDTNVVIPSPGTLIIPNATPGWSGTYTVDVTTDGCTSASSMFVVQVKEPLFPPSILSPPLVCEGDSLVLVSDAPAGAILHWISSNGFDSFENQPVIYPVLPQDAGTYQVLYTLDDCPSPPSNPYDISVQEAVMAPSIVSDITAVCIDNPVPVNLCIEQGSLIAGATYTWFLNGSTVIGTPGEDSCITINGTPLQGGINAISATASLQGCPSDQGTSLEITGDEVPSQAADAGADLIICPGEVIMLDAADPSQGSGLWTSSDDIVIFSDPSDPNADIVGLPSGVYGLAWTLSYASCVDYSQDSVTIEVISTPVTFTDTVEVPFGQTTEFIVTLNDQIPGDPYTLTITSNPQKGNALYAGNGIIRYTPNVGFVGTDMLIYSVCSTECPGECSESIVVLKVGNEDDCFIPSLFTPNQDGVNDILIIPCLETDKYPNNKIIIFNEWGAAIFTASPYLNDWDGSASGNPLPVGTYFYIMDFGDGNTPKRSFLLLDR